MKEYIATCILTEEYLLCQCSSTYFANAVLGPLFHFQPYRSNRFRSVTLTKMIRCFVNRSTNAAAESIKAKIKQFRAQLRGIIDRKFLFLNHVTLIYLLAGILDVQTGLNC